MAEFWFALPGALETPTGGYVYARRVLAEWANLGYDVRVLGLSAEFPHPSAAALDDCAGELSALPRGSSVLFDGLAFGALPYGILAPLALDIVALVHHPLALETGLDPARAAALAVSERAALAMARAVVCTSRATRDTLAERYDVPEDKLRIAPPGCDPAPRAPGNNQPPVLLTVAAVSPRKGHDVLLKALAQIADLQWTSRIVGSVDRDPSTAAALRAEAAAAGLEGRISWEGVVADSELAAAYLGADIFVLPSRHEGYGMAFAEALARGLPVVACRAGAAAETIPADAGILVDTDDVEGVAAALRRLLTDQAMRRRSADAAYRHASGLPAWRDTARCLASVLCGAAP